MNKIDLMKKYLELTHCCQPKNISLIRNLQKKLEIIQYYFKIVVVYLKFDIL